ncbi:glycosyltransferase family 4 protein [Thioalkalivibrio versutus]|uniref:glycosyltransferase family 4 protein n=1 Tax=Thioalkalivibrio versutus TaxID=106634 RepID=UPI000985C1C1|nr:glycosyltransferase family 4 protein [Thioalkalivibrio versutus]OOC50171.1 group 1 glycosyl transferase [Thioalkalivibrio versutus]
MRELGLVVPGSLEQRTGGYRYDARMVAGLRVRGWTVTVRELEGAFPGPNPAAESALDAALAGFPDRRAVLLDGLAAGAFPGVLARHAERLHLIYLLHHPLGLETGLEPARADDLLARERAAVGQVEGVLATSAFTAGQVATWGVSSGRLQAIPPGIEPRPQALGPGPGERPLLLCVGSVVPRKGQLELVQALACIRTTDWRAGLVGSRGRGAAYVQRVEAAITEAGLGDRIEWAGECDDAALEGWYGRASLFVLPSAYEGFGMAYTEAMARGLPVIGTTGGAIPATVPEAAGRLVPPGDIGALAEAIDALLVDAGARYRMGRVARDAMAERSDWDGAVAALEQTLEAWLQ